MKKKRGDIKEPTHVLTIKFDILRKSECHICQTVTFSFYSDKKVNFLNEGQLYIFHKLDYAFMFFRVCTCFSDNLA
jgi:hypothetical protein